MWPNRIAAWRQDIVGDWQPELRGFDLLELRRTRKADVLQLRSDGTWEWRSPSGVEPTSQTAPPFPPTWELSDERILSLWTPIAPMPEYEMPNWSREEEQYLVLSVTDDSLGLADGHEVVVYRRINREDHGLRRGDEYQQMLDRAHRIAENRI